MNKVYKIKTKSKISVLLLLGFMGVGLSQTTLQRKEIRANSNLTELSRLQGEIKKITPKVSELKKQAREIGMKYAGEYNGTLYQFSGFFADGSPRILQTFNRNAAITTGANKLYKEGGLFNLTGKGMTVGEWDGGGVLTSHVEFSGRVTQKDDPERVNSHATHVAGTLIAAGVNPAARGMAYEAHLNAHEWTNDVAEAIEEASNGLLLSNHSYGFNAGFVFGNYAGQQAWYWTGGEDEIVDKKFGKYIDTDQQWDELTYGAPYYLPVKAAGNSKSDGPEEGEAYYFLKQDPLTGSGSWTLTTKKRPKNGGEGGFDCIPLGTIAKNILTVGAVQPIPGGYKSPSDVRLASFSSTGPTDDGRIKPDIVGDGVNVYSTYSLGNQSYEALSGTSMASPNVTGSLLLLQQHYRDLNDGKFMKAATLKALLVNSANEAGNAPGPDYHFGHGLLNVFEGAKEISTDKKYSLLDERTLKQGQKDVIEIIASGKEPLKITMAWQDPAPETNQLPDYDVLDDPKKMLVNDLDIVVMKDDKKYYPWKLDPKNPAAPAFKGVNDLDNIEKIEIDNPEKDAKYKIVVTHKGTTLKNETQDYSIVASGLALVAVNDISIDKLEIKADRGEYTENTPVEVTFSNLAKATVDNAKIKYIVTNEDENKVEQEGEVLITDLKGKETAKKIFTIDLSHSFINYDIKVMVDYDKDEVIVNNQKRIHAYGILRDLTKENARFDYSFEESLDSQGWSSEDINKEGGSSWQTYRRPEAARTGDYSLVKINKNNAPDAWVYTNPLKLKGGETYRVIYYARNSNNFGDKLRVGYGKQPNSKSMNLVGEEESLVTGRFKRYYVEFTPTETGVYYVGLHNYTHDNEKTYAVIVDDFTIMNSKGKPYVDFSAQYRDPSVYDKDLLKNESLSGLPVTSYEWTITPNTVEFLDNTTRNSENPTVRFRNEGTYSIKLKVANEKGEVENKKENYIFVKNRPLTPDFKASVDKINDNNKIQIFDNSVGRPYPNKWNGKSLRQKMFIL